MNCREFQNDLSSGEPLTPEAADHARSCANCGPLLRMFEGTNKSAEPDASRVAVIQRNLISSLRPVKPLPSDGRLAQTALIGAVLLALICTLPFGYLGIRVLSMGQMAIYYGVVLLAAILLAYATAQDIIPGAKSMLSRVPLIFGTFAALVAIVLLMFARSDHAARGRGVLCLEIGLFSAVVAGIAACFFLRRGVLTTPIQTCCLAGTFAGLVGFGVLALHCPILRASHILGWHLGAMAIAGCTGALIGFGLELLARSREITSAEGG